MLILLILFTLVQNILSYVRDDCVCGVVTSDTRRIINGVEAEPLKYQWMVALFNAHEKAHCGGALISDMHVRLFILGYFVIEPYFFVYLKFQVLTAGHCTSLE